MARNPMVPAAPVPDVNLPVARLQEEQRLAAGAEAYAMEKSEIAQRIGEVIGRRQMGDAISKLLTVSTLLDAKNIKQTKAYVGFTVIKDGKPLTVSTWEEACPLIFGESRQSMDNRLLNIEGLGPELYEALENIGIGPGKMRDLRQIPQEARQELLLAAEKAATEEAEENRKEAFLEVANGLLAKSARDKQLLEAQVESMKKAHQREMDAKERVIGQKNQMTENLQRSVAELEQALHGKQTEAPDWDKRVGEARMQVTVHTGLLLQQADKLAWWREQLLTMMVQLDDAPARALAVDYMDKMEQVLGEVTSLANAGHDAFGPMAELARLEGADYRLSELPALDGHLGAEREQGHD